MSDIEVYFEPVDEVLADLLIAELSMAGAESFWHDDERLRAYFSSEGMKKVVVEKIYHRFLSMNINLSFGIQEITPGNWDVAQDDVFDPIVIDNKCLICGSDAELKGKYPLELIVNPKLSFGSGHHPSTALCIAIQMEMDFKRKCVLDIGCGSGILALVAEKLGATKIDAIDNNPWAIVVAKENLELNSNSNIYLQEADISSADLAVNYPVVLANLNASVLLDNFGEVAGCVKKGGVILVSGYMEKDQEAIHALARTNGLMLRDKRCKDEWIAALFEKK